MSTSYFIICLLLPLFSIPYMLKHFCVLRKSSTKELAAKHNGLNAKTPVVDEVTGSANLIKRLLSDPYKTTNPWGLCWEGVIALRILVIVIIATFVSSLLFRHVMLVVVCLFVLILQLKVKPFSKSLCNTLELSSLTIVLGLSVMNLVNAEYFQTGEVPEQAANKVFEVYDWFEAFFFGIIPLIIVSLAVVGVLVRVLAWPLNNCVKLIRRNQDTPSERLSNDYHDYHKLYQIRKL